MKYLKKEGKGTVTHKPRLHNRFNEKAMTLAFHCLKVGMKLFAVHFENSLFRLFSTETTRYSSGGTRRRSPLPA